MTAIKKPATALPERFEYSRWRHGGWYVLNVRYPTGAVGCVTRNYPDRKWRIACDPRPFEYQPTFKCRDDAAKAEWALAHGMSVAKGLLRSLGEGV